MLPSSIQTEAVSPKDCHRIVLQLCSLAKQICLACLNVSTSVQCSQPQFSLQEQGVETWQFNAFYQWQKLQSTQDYNQPDAKRKMVVVCQAGAHYQGKLGISINQGSSKHKQQYSFERCGCQFLGPNCEL